MDDELLAKEIAAKLGDAPGISYIDIAYKALDQGKKSLAVKVRQFSCICSNDSNEHSIWFYDSFVSHFPQSASFVVCCIFQLLDYEPKASNQVPLLLRMEKFELALQKALDSGDMDQG